MQSLVWSLRLMTVWLAQWKLSYMSRRCHDTGNAYTHLFLFGTWPQKWTDALRKSRMWSRTITLHTVKLIWFRNKYLLRKKVRTLLPGQTSCLSFLGKHVNHWYSHIKDIFFHCYSFQYSLSSWLWYYRICQKCEIVNVKTGLNCRQNIWWHRFLCGILSFLVMPYSS